MQECEESARRFKDSSFSNKCCLKEGATVHIAYRDFAPGVRRKLDERGNPSERERADRMRPASGFTAAGAKSEFMQMMCFSPTNGRSARSRAGLTKHYANMLTEPKGLKLGLNGGLTLKKTPGSLEILQTAACFITSKAFIKDPKSRLKKKNALWKLAHQLSGNLSVDF